MTAEQEESMNFARNKFQSEHYGNNGNQMPRYGGPMNNGGYQSTDEYQNKGGYQNNNRNTGV